VKPLRDVVELRAHFGVELAVVGGFDEGDAVGFGGGEVGEFSQQVAAGGGGEASPGRAVEGGFGGGYGAVNVFFRAARD